MTKVKEQLTLAHNALFKGNCLIAQAYTLSAMRDIVKHDAELEDDDLKLFMETFPAEEGNLLDVTSMAMRFYDSGYPMLCLATCIAIHNKLSKLVTKEYIAETVKGDLMISAGVCPLCHQNSSRIIYNKMCLRCLSQYQD